MYLLQDLNIGCRLFKIGKGVSTFECALQPRMRIRMRTSSLEGREVVRIRMCTSSLEGREVVRIQICIRPETVNRCPFAYAPLIKFKYGMPSESV
jgi:hypothetical protein